MNLIERNDHLLLAVSGGIDSMVLLQYLSSQAKEMNLTLSVAHLDHQKRKESFLDCQLVTDVCQKLSIACYSEKLDMNDTENFHDYAHVKRYDFFASTAKKIGANKIVLAHNADDHAETIVMRLVRGSSFEGYRGILPVSNYQDLLVIRPMLRVSRTEIIEYQSQNHVPYNEDGSNQEDRYTRNRYRHHVMPFFEQENPRYLDKFNQFSDYIDKAYQLIEKLANAFLADNLIKYKDSYAMDIFAFNQIDEIIKIETLKRIVNRLTENQLELSYTNIKDILKLFNNEKPHVELSLSETLFIYKSYNMVYFQKEKTQSNQFHHVIYGLQEIHLPDGALFVITTNPNKYYGNIYKLCYNNLDLIFPLVVRNRIDGDKINTTSGTKKLKDIFINKKIPMETRNNLPVVLDRQQEIIWVPDIYKAKSNGDQVLYLIYQEGKEDA